MFKLDYCITCVLLGTAIHMLTLFLNLFLKPHPFLIVEAGKEWLFHRLPFTLWVMLDCMLKYEL